MRSARYTISPLPPQHSIDPRPQYKKRKRNLDERDPERAPSPDLEEKLKDATTLYVGMTILDSLILCRLPGTKDH